MKRKITKRNGETTVSVAGLSLQDNWLFGKLYISRNFYRCALIPGDEWPEKLGYDGEGITPSEACDFTLADYVSDGGDERLARMVVTELLEPLCKTNDGECDE